MSECVAPANVSPGIVGLAREMRETAGVDPTYVLKYTVGVDSVDKSYLYIVAECGRDRCDLGPIRPDHEEFSHENVMKWRLTGENWPVD